MLDAVYEVGLVPTMAGLPRVVARLAWELVPCDHSGWVVLDFASGKMSGEHWPTDLSPYFDRVPGELAAVPLVPAAAVGPTNSVIRLSDFYSPRQLHDTAVYSELYRTIGVEYQLVVPLSFATPGSSGLRGKRAESLTLARWDSDFTDRERAMLDEFGRHVRSAARRLRAGADSATTAPDEFGLTARQSEALLAVAGGATVRSAATELGISPKTLENHLQAAYLRLGVTNRTAALARLRGRNTGPYGLGEIPH